MKISVLIPAFRPTYLGQAIASVLTQGFEDFELIISDDSGGGAVEAVVRRFRDSRIRYLRTTGRTGALNNTARLWREASSEVLKYLLDDDLMLPGALVELADHLVATPRASLVFGHRDVIDGRGRVTAEPRMIAPNQVARLSRPTLANHFMSSCHNAIGELSNVLINRGAGADLDDLFFYRGQRLVGLNDVAFYLNLAAKGPVVGAGRTVGQFRRHEAQNSSWRFNPEYSKAVCEWEFLLRHEFAAGAIDQAAAFGGLETLDRLYGIWEGRLPELARLRRGPARLRDRIAAADPAVLDEEFQSAWAETDAAVEARRSAQRSAVAGT